MNTAKAKLLETKSVLDRRYQESLKQLGRSGPVGEQLLANHLSLIAAIDGIEEAIKRV